MCIKTYDHKNIDVQVHKYINIYEYMCGVNLLEVIQRQIRHFRYFKHKETLIKINALR